MWAVLTGHYITEGLKIFAERRSGQQQGLTDFKPQ
jgi:hypothetical protein